MSIKTMNIIWESNRFEGGTLLVLLAMADYANEDHECRPSISSLARKARLSDRQVARILKQLRSDGVITAAGTHPTTQGSPIVIYRINTIAFMGDILSSLAPEKPAMGDMATPLKGDKRTPLRPEKPAKGDICDTLRVTPMSYDPTTDPSIELQEEEGAATPTATAAEPPAWYESDPDPEPEPQPEPTPVPVTAKTLTQQPVIAMYRDAFLRFPSKAQMNWLLAQDVAELRRWHEVLELWVGKGWAATNLSGMVDLYRNPQRIQELRTYQGGTNAITTNRATNDRRAKGGAGGVLGGSPGYPAGGYPNGRANAAAFDARPTAALVETDDDGEDIYL